MNEGIHLDLDTWIVPGQIRKGVGKQIHTSRYRGVDLSRSSQHPTAIPGGAECHNCEHPQLRCPMHCPEAYTSIT